MLLPKNKLSSRKLINIIYLYLPCEEHRIIQIRNFPFELPHAFFGFVTPNSLLELQYPFFAKKTGRFRNGFCSLHRPMHYFKIKKRH